MKTSNENKSTARKFAEKVVGVHTEFISKFRGHLITAITAAFALVIALSWNDAIRQGIDQLISKWGIVGSSYLIKILSALIVTIISVFGIYLVSKLDKKK